MAEIIIKSFYSKKNEVHLVCKNGLICMRKIFGEENSFLREKAELLALKEINVPQIIEIKKNCIYTSYIEGELLLDKYLSASIEEMPQLANMFADFLISYTNLRKGKLLADMNFRNFIVSGEKVFGVDFEEVKEGDFLLSVAQAIAFCMLYDIDMQKKEEFAKCLIQRFEFDKEKFAGALNHELCTLKKRRNIN